MKPCLMDSGFLYALVDQTDSHSRAVKNSLREIYGEVILPVPAITETAHFVLKNLGAAALANFVEDLPEMNVIFETPLAEDYKRAADILRKYNDANIDFVDAVIVAIAERLDITKILTIDRRHFGAFKPRHCAAFEILP
ncbi:MAG: type II toxin-antitoxin system VapC family toxin [Pyrinomonadaceae bacterium]